MSFHFPLTAELLEAKRRSMLAEADVMQRALEVLTEWKALTGEVWAFVPAVQFVPGVEADPDLTDIAIEPVRIAVPADLPAATVTEADAAPRPTAANIPTATRAAEKTKAASAARTAPRGRPGERAS